MSAWIRGSAVWTLVVFANLVRAQDVRLAGGRGPHEGTVTVQWGYQYGMVCDDGWSLDAAHVVCRQLGYSGARAATANDFFGFHQGSIFLDEVQCSGQERRLVDCRHDAWGRHDCLLEEAAGVICEVNGDQQRPMTTRATVRATTRQTFTEAWMTTRPTTPRSTTPRPTPPRATTRPVVTTRPTTRMPFTEAPRPRPPQQFAPDLEIDVGQLQSSLRITNEPLYQLECSMEENCLASDAYRIRAVDPNWAYQRRRLLRFSTIVWNVGNIDFRPDRPRDQWQWHLCHMHFHSMEAFARYDLYDSSCRRVAEGHKNSFCLEDSAGCRGGRQASYACANGGNQGISVGCGDAYLHNLDCQWIDVTNVRPGRYTMTVQVNGDQHVYETNTSNNVVSCDVSISDSSIQALSCRLSYQPCR